MKEWVDWLIYKLQILRYLGSCLAHTAGVTQEDKVTNRSLGPVSRYLVTLLKQFNDGLCVTFAGVDCMVKVHVKNEQVGVCETQKKEIAENRSS